MTQRFSLQWHHIAVKFHTSRGKENMKGRRRKVCKREPRRCITYTLGKYTCITTGPCPRGQIKAPVSLLTQIQPPPPARRSKSLITCDVTFSRALYTTLRCSLPSSPKATSTTSTHFITPVEYRQSYSNVHVFSYGHPRIQTSRKYHMCNFGGLLNSLTTTSRSIRVKQHVKNVASITFVIHYQTSCFCLVLPCKRQE